MINHNDQQNLFELISTQLAEPLTCWAFGGTAMMFYGYKEETKDIDLLFSTSQDRQVFVDAIEKLGFRKTSPFTTYIEKKAQDSKTPLMYENQGIRFDLFAHTIFRTQLSELMQEDRYATHEYTKGERLTIHVMRKEHLVYLKAITERKNDYDDIITIITQETRFDWQYLIDEALWQHRHGDDWALLDTEKTLKALKDHFFIPENLFLQLYDATKE